MQDQQMPDMSMDASTLYQEESFTDGQVGEIRRLTPVKSDGTRDESRSVSYTGSTQIMTSAGPIPLSFEIEADSLDAAVAAFGTHAQEKLEETTRKLEEMRKEQASSILTPDQLAGGGQGGQGGFGGGGMGGGFQMR
jgi:hypothetical protein